MSWICVAIAAVALLFVPQSGTAGAVAAARLELFPSHPRVGHAATLQLRPYRSDSRDWLPALLPAGTNWRVTLTRVGRRTAIPVRVSRGVGNPYLWVGSIRFPTRGRWIVRIAGAPKDSLRVDVAASTPTPGVWETLERPLRIPTIKRGIPCPVTAQDPKGDLSRIGGPNTPAWGTGPAYPTTHDTGPTGGPVLRFPPGRSRISVFYGSRWSGQKVVWYVDRDAYQGPLLIRGRQVDGMDTLRFDSELVPPREIRVLPESRVRGGATRVRKARSRGCYAYQVDGTSFSSLLVFEAVRTSSD